MKLKLQEWNKIIADKKSVMMIILNQCDKATRVEIALGSSYKDNLEAGEHIKFLARIRTVYNGTNYANVFFGYRVTKITEHHVQPTLIVKEIIITLDQ